MGRKKTVKKSVIADEKENINCDYNNNQLNKSLLNDCGSNQVDTPPIVTEQKKFNPESIDTSSEKEKSIDDTNRKMFLVDVSNINNQQYTYSDQSIISNNISQDVSNISRQKRFCEDDLENEFIQIKKKCMEMENRLESLESLWQGHLNEVQDIFDNIPTDLPNDDSSVVHQSASLPIDPTNIDDKLLQSLVKKSATSTARSLLKYFMPNYSIDMKLGDIDSSLIQWIVEFSKKSHPNDSSSSAKIRHAMANVFSLAKLKRKRLFRNSNLPI